MAIYLIVYGHGAGDPGAGGDGTNERDFTRKILHPFVKKWADRSKHTFVFYDISGNKDLYQDTARGWGLYNMTSKQYDSVTEIHLDAASSSATGGHVIINSKYNPDKYDLALAQIINKIVGWWGSVKNKRGVNGRNNLLNCNVAARRGINYRLMELGFITNKTDMSKIRNNLDAYAKGIVEGITGETLAADVKSKPEYHKTRGWYRFKKDDTLYTDRSFGKDKVSGIKLGKGSRVYADEVVTNPSGTAWRGVILRVGKSGKRYFTLNKEFVEKD